MEDILIIVKLNVNIGMVKQIIREMLKNQIILRMNKKGWRSLVNGCKDPEIKIYFNLYLIIKLLIHLYNNEIIITKAKIKSFNRPDISFIQTNR